MQNVGTVIWIKASDWNGKKLYTFTLKGESDMFYQLGEGNQQTQGLAVGDEISFEWNERTNKKGYKNKVVDLSTVSVTKGEGKIDPGTGKVQGPNIKDLRYNYGFCSQRGIEFVKLLLETEVDGKKLLNLPKTKPQDALFKAVEVWSEEFYRASFDEEKLLSVLPKEDEEEEEINEDDPFA